jgi:hypothetical protein
MKLTFVDAAVLIAAAGIRGRSRPSPPSGPAARVRRPGRLTAA